MVTRMEKGHKDKEPHTHHHCLLDGPLHIDELVRLDDSMMELFQLPATPVQFPQLPHLPATTVTPVSGSAASGSDSPLLGTPGVATGSIGSCASGSTPVVVIPKGFRMKVKDVFRRNSASVGLDNFHEEREGLVKDKSNVHSRSFVRRSSLTASTRTKPTMVFESTMSSATYSVLVADVTSSETSGSNPFGETTVYSIGPDILPPIVEHEVLLPSKWFGRLPKHFMLSLLELLSPAHALVLCHVDQCMNEIINEYQAKFFLPEKNTKIITPNLTWRHVYSAKHRKNLKSCNIVFCGAPQTGTKSTLIRSMSSYLARKIAEMNSDKHGNEPGPPSKGKTKRKLRDKELSVFQSIQIEETEEDRIEQELQKFYATSFLQTASFYYGLANSNLVKLNCYELGTEEYMIDAAAQQLRNSNAIVFGFDVTSAESFSYFDFLVPRMKQIVQPWCVLLLAANKCDLDHATWCSYGTNEKGELTKFAAKYGIEKHFFMSARHGTGVDYFVDYLAYAVGVKRQPTRTGDYSVDECKQCSLEFRLLKRKHHCRHCGGVFCNECTMEKTEIPEMNIKKPARVCAECRELLLEHKDRREQPLWCLLDLL